ncbi:MAG: hypothetical protein KME50_14110 [Nostoc desertorum CM1-VF14]|nr:hypothetical protein [Nostoc desertorum CM1-VF14]
MPITQRQLQQPIAQLKAFSYVYSPSPKGNATQIGILPQVLASPFGINGRHYA